jgi:hypothetical protein
MLLRGIPSRILYNFAKWLMATKNASAKEESKTVGRGAQKGKRNGPFTKGEKANERRGLGGNNESFLGT